MHNHTQQHVIGGVLIVIALAHFIWPSQIAEFNSQRPSIRINPTTVSGVRALGVVLLLMGLLAVLT
jgi:asparagine N-glycosylation enzyme membrane subunit Stt3